MLLTSNTNLRWRVTIILYVLICSATMMTDNNETRILVLEEQVKTLSEELMQCQVCTNV